jgi:hypothetical protein
MVARTPLRFGALLGILTLAVACSEVQEPIVVEEGSVTIQNLTDSDWKGVRITVNDYFNGGVPSLAAGQRMNAPLSQFQSGLGQRYDRTRMSPYKVEVTATDARGNPVKLIWGENRTAK